MSADELLIPELGDASSGIISPRQEYELGQKWLRMYRARVPTTKDPFLQIYTENLIRRLATYSELRDKRLDILVVDNPTLNAFAVPGGIVGVHTGLFTHAETEDQFSSVLAHELAHLSQRHYARTLEQQKNNAIPNMAALLASILIAATAGGDAGMAAIYASQSMALDQQLRFSRQMEQEADRIGMETMVKSGNNPYAMSEMFESMLRASRFYRRPPEFLLTHPLTESRVADTQQRALKFDKKYYAPSQDYQLVKIRAELLHEANVNFAIRKYETEIEGHKYDKDSARYGLVLAYSKARRFEDAQKALAPLLKQAPDNLYYAIEQAQIDAELEHYDIAKKRFQELLTSYPNYHPLVIRYAETLMQAGDYKACAALLKEHSKRRPTDDYVWYLLAEVNGLVGNIFEVHTARAEYFSLNGLYDKAIIQLKNALRLVEKDQQMQAVIEQKLKEVRRLREETKM
ncbi:Beta-barrel assembly-enhancing protease [Thalassocella blandensis]|nr:Beta-barrel assembly-enhancing protease [Thalassocella blandensis]